MRGQKNCVAAYKGIQLCGASLQRGALFCCLQKFAQALQIRMRFAAGRKPAQVPVYITTIINSCVDIPYRRAVRPLRIWDGRSFR